MIKHENAPLAPLLYYRIGGTARFLLEAHDRDDVLEALDFVRAHPEGGSLIVGLGSNLLFPDGRFEGTVLRIVAGEPRMREVGEGLVEAYAGNSLDEVINFGFSLGYAGLEWAGGLPGTVGAAVRGNVGAFGGELKDVLASAEVAEATEEGVRVTPLDNAGLGFSYRHSVVKQNRRLVVLSATFRLHRPDGEGLERARRSYRANIEYRQTHHPLEYPTCGSVFKNIEKREDVEKVLAVWPDAKEMVETRWHGKLSMGYSMGRLGLSGFRIGSAQVSPKHNNFIVNLGGASFTDVQGIIEAVQQKFLETFGFAPEAEVEIVDSKRG